MVGGVVQQEVNCSAVSRTGRRICDAAYRVGFDDRAARRFFEGNFPAVQGDQRQHRPGSVLATTSRFCAAPGILADPIPSRSIAFHPEAALANGRAAPMPTRAQIGGLERYGGATRLLWVDDPADAFFLHVQGSGQVAMTDGSRVRVGFAGQGGHPTSRSEPNWFAQGEVPQERMSMRAIRSWLATRSRQAPGLMALDGSYVFFTTDRW